MKIVRELIDAKITGDQKEWLGWAIKDGTHVVARFSTRLKARTAMRSIKLADRIDSYDRDDLGESQNY